MQNSIGGSSRIRPRHSVPISTKNTNPVGIEINSVLSIVGRSRDVFAPDQYRWCIHTAMLRMKMPISPPTTSL